jgi:hypothetical protein
MAFLQLEQRWRTARDGPFVILAVAIVLSLFRAVDQPGVTLAVGGTEIRLVPADFAILVLAVLCVLRLLGRGSLPRPARTIAYSAAAFSAWLLISSAISGFEPFVGAVKLLEYGVLGLGTVLFVQRRAQLWLLVALLVGMTAAAAAYGLFGFFDLPPVGGAGGKRQPSFLGEHDLAALGTMALAFGLAALYAPGHRLGKLPLVAIVSGSVAVTLGAAIAGVGALLLAVAAIVGLALARHAATRRAVTITALVTVLVAGGTLALRWGELGSVFRWIGVQESEVDAGGIYAASFSQRVIFIYLGGRMFLDSPVAGVGWYGEIPGREYALYLPDARERFPGQPPGYFPTADGEFTPQQTYDQVLYELGVVGALLFLTLAFFTARTALSVGRRWPRGDPDVTAAYLPLAWTGALAGGLAGAALFGGIPFAALFWVTLGVVALAPSLVPARAVVEERVERTGLQGVATR